MTQGLEGGCACGAVRYALASQPFDCGWCHCMICRKVSGAPAMVFATVPVTDLVFVDPDGKLGLLRSSSFGRRRYCTACGSPLTMEVDHQPETIDFAVSTLDDANGIRPEFHIFHASRIAWFDPDDGLPRYEKFRPDTRGLEGTDPPA